MSLTTTTMKLRCSRDIAAVLFVISYDGGRVIGNSVGAGDCDMSRGNNAITAGRSAARRHAVLKINEELTMWRAGNWFIWNITLQNYL